MFDIVTWDFVHKYSEDVKLGLEVIDIRFRYLQQLQMRS